MLGTFKNKAGRAGHYGGGMAQALKHQDPYDLLAPSPFLPSNGHFCDRIIKVALQFDSSHILTYFYFTGGVVRGP